jgi:hypothetical protein
MPAINFDLMLQAAMSAKAEPNQIVFWSRLPDWKSQTLTPNPDAARPAIAGRHWHPGHRRRSDRIVGSIAAPACGGFWPFSTVLTGRLFGPH